MNNKVTTPSGREFNPHLLREHLKWAQKLKWIESIWTPKDALKEKDGGSTWLFTGQEFDETKVELVKNGWTHDHCDICSADIRKTDPCAISGANIICVECHDDFIKNISGT